MAGKALLNPLEPSHLGDGGKFHKELFSSADTGFPWHVGTLCLGLVHVFV